MKKKHLINIGIVFVISIIITFAFSLSFGSSFNIIIILKNILYGVIIGGSISLSGFLAHYIIKKSDVDQHPIRTYTTLLISITIYITVAVFVVNGFWYKFTQGADFLAVFTSSGIIISIITILIGLVIFFIILSKKYMEQFIEKNREVLRIKQDADKSKFETLKSQINPHFLFNSLNTLSSLILIDTQKADEFTNKLSDIYRYILDNQDNELVSLKKEIAFIKTYAYLQSIRFDDNFSLEIDDNCDDNNILIMPLALQIIVENVFKHNVISEKKKVTISIKIDNENIVVKNNKVKKIDIEVSHNVGLQNIINRYKLICDKKCDIINNKESFIVKLPIISKV